MYFYKKMITAERVTFTPVETTTSGFEHRKALRTMQSGAKQPLQLQQDPYPHPTMRFSHQLPAQPSQHDAPHFAGTPLHSPLVGACYGSVGAFPPSCTASVQKMWFSFFLWVCGTGKSRTRDQKEEPLSTLCRQTLSTFPTIVSLWERNLPKPRLSLPLAAPGSLQAFLGMSL